MSSFTSTNSRQTNWCSAVSETLDFATQSRSGEDHAPTPDQSFRHAHLVYDEPQPEGARTLRVRIPRTDPEAR